MTQPKALRLADLIRSRHGNDINDEAAAELRRLHAERAAADGVINDLVAKVRELQEANEAFGKRQEWWNEKMLTLEAQRGALLEVLIRCRDRFFPANQPERDRDELWEPVNAAIKAVEEDAPLSGAEGARLNPSFG